MKLLTKSVVVATVLCFVAGLSAGAAVSSYSSGPGDLFAGDNLFALPVVPTDLDGSGRGPGYPEFILAGFDLSGTNLQRWNTATQAFLSRGDSGFGNLLSTDGYKLAAAGMGSFTFNGANDLQQTDYWISLPKTGTTIVGNPYLYSVDWSQISVTNGMETVSIDAAISTKGWLSGITGLDNYWKTDSTIGKVADIPASSSALFATRLEPWRGYKVTSLVDNLALIVTARKSTDAAKYSIKGTISLEGYTGGLEPQEPVIVELRSADGSTKLARTIKHVGASSDYALDGVAPGTYTVAAKGVQFLAQVISGVTVVASDKTGVNFSLLNGDVNGDNFVEDSDYGILSADWYTSAPAANGTDLNGDGFVEDSDYGILSANWYVGGDGAW